MTDLTIFNYESKEVRTVMVDGEPWFVARDVCKAIGLENLTNSLAGLEPEEKGVNEINTLGGLQSISVISEPGLYRLLMRSNMPLAKPFQKWVVSEVLPSIRKTGQYGQITPSQLSDNDIFSLAEALVDTKHKLQNVERLREIDKPFTDIGKRLTATDGTVLMRQLAKVIDPSGKVIGQDRLFKLLYRDKILISKNEPYQKYNHWFWITTGYHDQNGKDVAHHTLRVNAVGRTAIYNRYQHLVEQPGLALVSQDGGN